MAIPTSPSVVVLENDVSIYTPNINSSVVGLVGFANKGPVNKPTLITSQENLIRLFGKPDTDLEGQGLEGALEILEATNQLYFVRGIDTSAATGNAVGNITVGASPAVIVSGYEPGADASSIRYTITDNAGTTTTTGLVSFASSTGITTRTGILRNAFNPDILGSQDVFAYVEGNDVYLASKYAGSGATFSVSSDDSSLGFSGLGIFGAAIGGDEGVNFGSSITVSGFTASNVDLKAYSVYPGTGYNITTLRDGTTQGVSVEVNNLSTRDQIVVNSDGAQVESFNAIELSPSSNNYAEFVLNSDINNNQSEYVYVNLVKDSAEYDAPNQFGVTATAAGFVGGANTSANSDVGTPRFLKLVEGTYNLAGGDSGAKQASSLVGTAALKTGMYALDDDGLNISIAAIPGVTTQSVQNAFVTLAESSKNFLAIVSPPYGFNEVQDAIQWINGQDAGTRDAALNSSYAAVYWPWVQVFNSFAAADQWYDPAIFAARQCVFTDSVVVCTGWI